MGGAGFYPDERHDISGIGSAVEDKRSRDPEFSSATHPHPLEALLPTWAVLPEPDAVGGTPILREDLSRLPVHAHIANDRFIPLMHQRSLSHLEVLDDELFERTSLWRDAGERKVGFLWIPGGLRDNLIIGGVPSRGTRPGLSSASEKAANQDEGETGGTDVHLCALPLGSTSRRVTT
jgi:hypothetical protein